MKPEVKCHCVNVGFGTYKNTVSMMSPWDKKWICIDTCVATAIGFLWGHGVVTLNSCCGHGKFVPTVIVTPDSVQKMLDMGYQNYKGYCAVPEQTFKL